MSLPSIQSLMRRHGIAPDKRLGQHFLANASTAERIARALEAEASDAVIEIGSGVGIMAAILARSAGRVIAVERDPALLDIARREFSAIANVSWIEADVLGLDLGRLIAGMGLSSHVKVIGNLPYNISSPIIFWMLDWRRFISTAVIMVQREVGMRLAAVPGNKDYGILSVILQASARVRKLFDVGAANFIPRPKVDSAVVRIDFAPGCELDDDEAWFRAVVKAAFGKRRKTLRNAILMAGLPGLTAERLDRALEAMGIAGQRRPEELAVDEFKMLAEGLSLYKAVRRGTSAHFVR